MNFYGEIKIFWKWIRWKIGVIKAIIHALGLFFRLFCVHITLLLSHKALVFSP